VEIGAKRSASFTTRKEWNRDLDAALDADVSNIILEGGGLGTTGIYNGRGMENSLLVGELQKRAGDKADRFIVEAPKESQRKFWMQELFGWNVRLGNIPLEADALQKTDRMRLDAMKPDVQANLEDRKRLQSEFMQEVLASSGKLKMDPDDVIFSGGLNGLPAETFRDNPHWKEMIPAYLAQMRTRPQFVEIRITPEMMRRMMRFMFGLEEGE
jgi:hypothetical protein